MTNAREYVEPAGFTPLPYGLLRTVVDVREPSTPNWQLGVTYEPICGGGGTTYEKCYTVTGSGIAPAVPPTAKADTGGPDRRGATAFTVYAEVDCSAPGFWDRAPSQVSQLMTQAEQWQVERAFWTGTASGQPVVFPHLAADAQVTDETGIILQSAATQVSGSSTLDVVEALGQLEQTMADCYDGVGYIHVPRNLAPALAEAHLTVEDGTRLRTLNGNWVVLGSGYRGTAPNGTSAFGRTWMYATGPMFIYRGPGRILPQVSTLDRAKNTVKAIMERTYVVAWSCCHVGVAVANGGVVAGVAAGSG